MRRIIMLITVVLLMVAMLALAGGPAQAESVIKTVRYGPFTIPAASGETPGMLEKVKLGVAKPCKDCFITSFSPNLTYPDGTTADVHVKDPDTGTVTHTGVMLHHAVFTSQFRSDPTCGSSGTLVGGRGRAVLRFGQ
jgi:hypothetical protein